MTASDFPQKLTWTRDGCEVEIAQVTPGAFKTSVRPGQSQYNAELCARIFALESELASSRAEVKRIGEEKAELQESFDSVVRAVTPEQVASIPQARSPGLPSPASQAAGLPRDVSPIKVGELRATIEYDALNIWRVSWVLANDPSKGIATTWEFLCGFAEAVLSRQASRIGAAARPDRETLAEAIYTAAFVDKKLHIPFASQVPSIRDSAFRSADAALSLIPATESTARAERDGKALEMLEREYREWKGVASADMGTPTGKLLAAVWTALKNTGRLDAREATA